MKNLQEIITHTKLELKKQETQMQKQLDELMEYVDSLSKLEETKTNINENDFSQNICQSLTNAQKTLKNLNIKLKNINNLSESNKKIIDAVYPISSMITSIKGVASSVILAQNQCALSGNLQNADKLAKISLELNYENHVFVKNASEEIKILKQNLNK